MWLPKDQREILFDLMELEADRLYFIHLDGKKASKAAIIIISSPVGHFPRRKGDRFTLWFGRGISRWTFRRLKDAEAKAEAILRTANRPITVEILDRQGRKTFRRYGARE